MATTAINKAQSTGHADEIYVGRARKGLSGYFGNPIVIGCKCFVCQAIHEKPGDTLPCYKLWFDNRIATDPQFKEDVRNLHGKILMCFCKPLLECHGDILAAEADHLAEEKV